MTEMTQIEQAIAQIAELKAQLPKGACAAQIAMESLCKDEAYNETIGILKTLLNEQNHANSAKSSKDLQEPKFKVGDRIRIKGSGAIGDVITNIYKDAQGNIMYAFRNSDDRGAYERNWELVEESASEDLEDASNNYCLNIRKGYPRVKDEIDIFICNAFKVGAEWQKEKDQKELQIAEEHGILTGMNMEHEKLMKNAVVVSFVQDYKYKTPILTGDIKNKFGLTTGQHVKLIIVKDE